MIDKSKTAVTIAPMQALLTGAMRGNAIAVWHDAAEMAENIAAEIEAGNFLDRSGPETCRFLAQFYRTVAQHLETESNVE